MASRDNDPITWFQVGEEKSGGKKAAAPTVDGNDPTTWFPVAKTEAKTATAPRTLSDIISSPEATSADVPSGDATATRSPAASRVLQAAGAAYEATPPLVTPQTADFYNRTLGSLGQYVVNPLLKIGGGAVGALSAVGAGLGQTAYEVGAAIDPRLGRDIYMGTQVAPMAHIGTGVPTLPSEAPLGPKFVQQYYGEGTATNPLAARPPRPAPAFIPPGYNLPPEMVPGETPLSSPPGPAFVPPRVQPATQEGVPVTVGSDVGLGTAQPVGAQASPTSVIGLTPAEEAAYRATAEGRKLLEPQQPGIPDRNAYVPGVLPNLAEQEQTVNTARELKSLGITSEDVSQTAKEIASDNNDARQQYFEGIARSPVDIANARAAREAQAQADLKATWANKTDADASPVIDLANQIKASPDGRRPAVRNAINSVTSELTDADGNLLTDPEQLYGVRKHLDDILSKEGQRETPLSARATASLQALKEQLDTSIEAAAPGFKQYLSNFSNASRNIDEMEVLQGHEAGLFDSQNRMTYNKVQTMMRNIVDSRNSPGINPYKSITDETMQNLWGLRDDLRRSASALELAKTPGSDTVQNMWDMVKGLASGPEAQAALHGFAAAHFGVPGVMATRLAVRVIEPLIAGRTTARQTQRGLKMLRPTNPLSAPDAASP